ncbi:MAG: putative toxin-antitoxin system toxin component, PIN family [Ferruginibacter sp.]|nr:putative toxin-antitoxin system toxin component, PIN family [Ferruginibacter sp.]
MRKNSIPLRLIIDSNLWISFLISNSQRKLDILLSTEQVKILFSIELLDELTRVSNYPKLKSYFGVGAVEEMLEILEPYIELIKVRSYVVICRDPKDYFLLSLAKDGKADFLLTGDKDLLILNKVEKTTILTITDFLKR